MAQIVDIQIARLKDRLADRGLSLELTDAARHWLADKGFDRRFGARPLKRVIQTELQDKLATAILDNSLSSSHPVLVDKSDVPEALFFVDPKAQDNPAA